jgi:hypothetical protein
MPFRETFQLVSYLFCLKSLEIVREMTEIVRCLHRTKKCKDWDLDDGAFNELEWNDFALRSLPFVACTLSHIRHVCRRIDICRLLMSR